MAYTSHVGFAPTACDAAQAEEAFVEYDVDKDGKVSWAEWQGIMFHEDHQVPEFRDGHDFDAVVDPLGDDDIDPDELEMIKNRFIKVGLASNPPLPHRNTPTPHTKHAPFPSPSAGHPHSPHPRAATSCRQRTSPL